jgi:hypothetical protein
VVSPVTASNTDLSGYARRVFISVGKYAIEWWAATYWSMAIAAMALYVLFPFAHFVNNALVFGNFNRILSNPPFPLQVIAALAMGCVGRRRFNHAFTYWVWTIPLGVFALRFALFEPSLLEDPWEARLVHFLGSGCRPPQCFDQMRYTAPVYTSFAYSLGALLEKTAVLRFRDPPSP